MKHWFVLLILAVLVVLVCGCTDTSAPDTTATATVSTAATPAPTTVPATPAPVRTTISVSDNTIIIRNNLFGPVNVTVKAGSTVRWVNGDDHPHNIAFTNKVFSKATYLLGATQSASQRFDKIGTFEYYDLIYPDTKGYITVVE
jgi:plastocyanin